MAADNIFISYSRTDSNFVIKLEEDLKRAGIDIWLDQKKISGGALWDRAIEEALEVSGIMILVISPNSALSENVANEVQYARDEGKIIVPIFIGQTKIPLTWRRYQRIDFIEDYEAGLNNLAQTLKHKMSLKQNNEAVKEEQRLKAKAEAKQKDAVEKRIKEEVEKKLKAIEELRLKEKAEAEEEKRIKEETEARRKTQEELRLKKEAEARQKAEEEKRIKEETEARQKTDEELNLKKEAEAKQKTEEEKRIKEETEAKRIAEHELRLKEVADANRKEEERKIKDHAISSKKDEEIIKDPEKTSARYIPFIIGIITVLVIIVWIVNSGRNNYRDESDPTYQFENNNYNSETGDWNDAKANNTIEGFKSFLLNYPDGVFFIEAQKKIDEIIDKDDWEGALSINTKVAYQEYLKKHPNGRWIADANQKINQIESITRNNNNSKFKIGQKYQGGIIIYIDATSQHGLIAAQFTQSTGIQWNNGTSIETGATGATIGTGRKNTDLIVSKQGAGNYAAKLCADLVLNGYDDWFLPSEDELSQLYKYVVGGSVNHTFWSSTEGDNILARSHNFKDGYNGYSLKSSKLYVLAFRAF